MSNRRCPLCGTEHASFTKITVHIRRNCPVAAKIRVYELGLPPMGYDSDTQLDVLRESDGRYSSGSASAD